MHFKEVPKASRRAAANKKASRIASHVKFSARIGFKYRTTKVSKPVPTPAVYSAGEEDDKEYVAPPALPVADTRSTPSEAPSFLWPTVAAFFIYCATIVGCFFMRSTAEVFGYLFYNNKVRVPASYPLP